MQYDTLVLSGGGIRGFIMLGALQYLKDKKILDNIETFIGTSIGTVISFLIIIGYDPSDIVVRFIQHKYLQRIQPASILGLLLKGNGVLCYDDFNKILEEMILEKMDTLPTLGDILTIYGKNLVCITYNYSMKTEKMFTSKNDPSLKVLDALRMSCNLPFVFSHFQHEGQYYFDGFLSNNFPIHRIPEGSYGIGITAKGTLCIENDDSLDFWKIIWNLFVAPLQELQSIKNFPFLDRCHIIELDMNKYSFLDYKLSSKEMLNMYSEGFSKTGLLFNEKEKSTIKND